MSERTGTSSQAVTIEDSGCEGATPKVIVGESVYWVLREDLVALREFFDGEKDDELRRFRWPENPSVVIYRYSREVVAVLDERTAEVARYSRGELNLIENMGGPKSDYSRAAAWFFRAHREPEPWHLASPGEHWVLTVEGVEREYVAITSRGKSGFYVRMFPVDDADAVTVGADAPVVTAGRRVWPEVAS